MANRIFIAALLAVVGCCGKAEPARVYTFSPQGTLSYALQNAANSLSDASGLDLAVAPGGVMVRLWRDGDVAFKYPGECANTVISFVKETRQTTSVEILINPAPGACGPMHRILEHEMIHALREWDSYADEPNQGHSEHGVFQAYATPGDRTLEETSLSALCQLAPCTAFVPESPLGD